MTSVTTQGGVLAITSLVIIHNGFDRANTLPMGPAHRIIVRAMLRRFLRGMVSQTPGNKVRRC